MNDEIPYGYCECGCGQKTKISPQSSAFHGHVIGKPRRFVVGHARTHRGDHKERFWKQVDRRESDECWEWQGDISAHGYGRFSYEGRQQIASRVVWIFEYGPIPEGMIICHHCDNPKCVNPKHLFMGTKADNNRDKATKGRSGSPHGESHFKAKLTVDQVREIRNLYQNGTANKSELARRYSMSHSAIRAILDGSHWKHIT